MLQAGLEAGKAWITSLHKRYQFWHLAGADYLFSKMRIDFERDVVVQDNEEVLYINITGGEGLPVGCSIQIFDSRVDLKMVVIVQFKGLNETIYL
jgi:hypothetical protein